jgi:Methyltransferase domain
VTHMNGTFSKSYATVATVWRRAFLDALIAPHRFRRMMPEFRRISDMLFHPGIASLHLAQIPAPQEPVQMLTIGSGYGGMPAQDLYVLLQVVHWLKPKRIFEIGTFQGLTTAHMILNSDAEIFTLDMPRDLATHVSGYSQEDMKLLQPREDIGKRYRAVSCDGRVHQLFGDSRKFDYGPYQNSMDLVLVDACHLFDYVMSDSRNAFKLLRETGAILWHDFGNSIDVNRACKLLAKQEPIFHLEGTWLALHVRGASLLGALSKEKNGQ